MRKTIALAAIVPVCLTLLVPTIAVGAVKPHCVFSDNMVLQQGKPVPIWGTADDNEEVTVSFQNQRVSTTTKDGRWLVRLESLKAGGPFELSIAGTNTVQLKNVLVGEVWICSGQSNMEWPVSLSANAKGAIDSSENKMIRLFTVPHRTATAPRHNLKGAWKECGPETVGNFTAVGYFFGRDLQKALGVPVGLIQTSWGGTLCEAWTSRQALKKHPDFHDVAAWEDAAWDRYVKALRNYEKAHEIDDETGAASAEEPKASASSQTKKAGQATKETAKAKRTRNLPQAPTNPAHDPNIPSALYNGMISPLLPYAIQGAIWYQGESNASRAYQYRTLFPAMIRNWREDWGQGDFPFLFVQLAPWLQIVKEPQDSAWAELREAQLLTTQNVPHTAMAVITDIGDEKDIHPRQKEPVGARLALAALGVAYGRSIVYSGPVYDHMDVIGNKARLSFKHVGDGLVAKGGTLSGFAIAGPDQKFVNAEAAIRDDHVEVWSPTISRPVAVRYGWANFPLGNLWNKTGLPASPFRTDDFPGVTGKGEKHSSRR